ncbi:MAG: tRNA (guanosine(37)-N1)-methyltransferase TrmD, partial [Clostridia bacterium]|nr:tRNA (guanosine(37)-N1)-methyltransferase TrmD [Clostridia bacterium]
MRFDILTLFPDMMQAVLGESIIGRAVENKHLELNYVNIRDFADNRHNRVDDYPYGGGKGMVMQPMPIYKAYQSVAGASEKPHVIYMSPQGKVFCQEDAIRLSKYEHVVILCGHYEGVDERVLEEIVDEEISAGDYVLTGGEIPAMMVVDAVARMLPGVLADKDSFEKESLYAGLLEHPQYTRPPEFMGKKVPEVLLSGHHVNIEAWQKKESLKRTLKKRPELLETATLDKKDQKILDDIKSELEGKPMNLTEKRKSSKTIYDGCVIRLEKDTALLPNGQEAIREVVRHPGGVAVVAVDAEGFVYMVRQFRYPVMKETLELPAGKLDKNEDTQNAA